MKKSILLILCALLICFAFSSCRNQYIPIWTYPSDTDTEPSVSKEEAAQLIASYVNEIGFTETGDLAKSLGIGLIPSALSNLDSNNDGNFNESDQYYEELMAIIMSLVLGSGVDNSAVVDLLDQMITDGFFNKLQSVPCKLGSEGEILNKLLTATPDESVTGNYSMQILDMKLPSKDELTTIVNAIFEDNPTGTAYPGEWEFSVKVAVESTEMNSEIFHEGSKYSYMGTLNLTVYGTIVNDEKDGNLYITIDRVVADTPNALQARTDVNNSIHKITISGVAADLGWKVDPVDDYAPLITYPSPIYIPDVNVGTVRYDGTTVSFADVLSAL